MGLSKDGYQSATHGTTKIKVPITQEGNIVADSTQTAAKQKRISFNWANAENNAIQNINILNTFVTIAGGSTDSLSNEFTVTWGV